MAAGLRPAEGVVAGDCYDVALISPDHVAVIVLDVAGHNGAESAVAALKCKELLKAALRSGLDPGPAVSWLSEQEHGLGELSSPRSWRSSTPTAAGAATPTPGTPTHSWRGADSSSGSGRRGPSSGRSSRHREQSMVVDPGGKLIIYTDGLVEARDADPAFFGESRLIDLLLALECPDAQPVVDHILGDLDDFHPGRLADDVTIVVACRAPDRMPCLNRQSVWVQQRQRRIPALTSRMDDDVRAEQTVR